MRNQKGLPKASAARRDARLEVAEQATGSARGGGQPVDRHHGETELGLGPASGADPKGSATDAAGTEARRGKRHRVGSGEAGTPDAKRQVGIRRNGMARSRARLPAWAESLARSAWLASLAERSRGIGLGFDSEHQARAAIRRAVRSEIRAEVHQQELPFARTGD